MSGGEPLIFALLQGSSVDPKRFIKLLIPSRHHFALVVRVLTSPCTISNPAVRLRTNCRSFLAECELESKLILCD